MRLPVCAHEKLKFPVMRVSFEAATMQASNELVGAIRVETMELIESYIGFGREVARK